MPWIDKPKRKNNNSGKYKNRQEVYNTTLWRRMRMSKLMEQPLCEVCLMMGKTTLAEHIHHIKSFVNATNIYERDELAFSYENLMSVCHECHNNLHTGYLKGCERLSAIKIRLEELNLINN